MSQGGSVPVLVLKEGTGRSTGREAQKNNIMAAKIVDETVKDAWSMRHGQDVGYSFGDVAISTMAQPS
jgi:hypothetical protein